MLTLYFKLLCDAPEKWQATIQDPASPALEGMLTREEYVIFVFMQLFVIGLLFLLFNYKNKNPRSKK